MLKLCNFGESAVTELKKRGFSDLQKFYEDGRSLDEVRSLVYIFPEEIAQTVSDHLKVPVHGTAVNKVDRLFKSLSFGTNFSLITNRARLLGVIDKTVIQHKFASDSHFILDGPSTFVLRTSEMLSPQPPIHKDN